MSLGLSQPPSAISRSYPPPSCCPRPGVFPSSLLEHAQDKIEARKPGNRKKEMKEEKRRLIGQKLDSGMSRAQVMSTIMFTHQVYHIFQVLEDVVLLDSNKKNSKKVKKLKHLIRDCDQGARARKEMRVAEFQERRGFRRFQQTGFQKERVERFPQAEEFIRWSFAIVRIYLCIQFVLISIFLQDYAQKHFPMDFHLNNSLHHLCPYQL